MRARDQRSLAELGLLLRALALEGTVDEGFVFLDLETDRDGNVAELAACVEVDGEGLVAVDASPDREALLEMFAGRFVVAHNGASHDFPILEAHDIPVHSHRIDSLRLAHVAWPTAPAHSLGALVEGHTAATVDPELAHRAGADADLLRHLWRALVQALAGIPEGQRAALATALAVSATDGERQFLPPATSGVPKVPESRWQRDEGSEPVRSAVIHQTGNRFALDVAGVHIVNDLRPHLADRPGAGIIATANRILDLERIHEELSGWALAAALRTLHTGRGLIDLAPAVYRAQLSAACMRGAEVLAWPGDVMLAHRTTVVSAPLSRPLVVEGLDMLFDPVPTGIVVPAPLEPGDAASMEDLSVEVRVSTRAALIAACGTSMLRMRAEAGEGSLVGTERGAVWTLSFPDPVSWHHGVIVLTSGPVGASRSRRLWERLLGEDVEVTGPQRRKREWYTLNEPGASPRRLAGRRTAQLLSIAAQWQAGGQSVVVVDQADSRSAIMRRGRAIWWKATGTHLLRPPAWPTIEEARRRMRRPHVALVDQATAHDLVAESEQLLLARLPMPSYRHPILSRLLREAGDSAFYDIGEPLAAHLTVELLCKAAGEVTIADPSLAGGLLVELIGTAVERAIDTISTPMDLRNDLLDALRDQASQAVVSQQTVRRATRRLLRTEGELKDFQEVIIEDIRVGADVLGVYPTGHGKSLCYQVPAVAYASMDVATIVVSPLLALQRDQVEALRQRGVFEATLYNSEMSSGLRAAVRRGIAAGFYRVVLVAPEALFGRVLCDVLASTDVGLVVIDEAHCISEMGHDFRPDYRSLPAAIRKILALPHDAPFPEAGQRPSILALTGTATPGVKQDISESVGVTFRTHSDTTFVRDELRFSVRHITQEDRWATGKVTERHPERWKTLTDILAEVGRPALVYATSRRDCTELADALRNEVDPTCLAYHAGLESGERRDREQAFLEGRVDLLVATSAFGMGIDKADIRSVVHWATPSSPEALYQEAGRAGRGQAGRPAQAVLLYDESDLDAAYRLIRRNAPRPDEVHRVDLVLREARDHSGSAVFTVADADVSRLAVLRTDVKPGVVLAHLERAGLIREIERLPGGRKSYVVERRVKDEPLSDVERAILERLGPPGATADVTVADLATDLADEGMGASEDMVRHALTSLTRRGLISRQRDVSVSRLEDVTVAANLVATCRDAARAVWNELAAHHNAKGSTRYLRSPGRQFGSESTILRAIEVLAAFGLVEVSYEHVAGVVPRLRRSGRGNPEVLRRAFDAAKQFCDVLEAQHRVYRLRDLAALVDMNGTDMNEIEIEGGLAILHLVQAASVDLRSWQRSDSDRGDRSDRPSVARRLHVLDVPDRDVVLEKASAEAARRAGTQRLRLEVLRKYAAIESDPESDPHQKYLERYLTEPDFMQEIVAGETAAGILEGLTEQQREACLAPTDQPLVLFAGPGTGKTRTVVHRMAYRVRAAEVPPEDVLAVTFSRTATEEIRSRLAQLAVRGVRVRTLHSIARQIVMENWRELGFDREPALVADDAERRKMLKDLGAADPDKTIREIDLAHAKCHVAQVGIPASYAARMRELQSFDFGQALILATDFLGTDSAQHIIGANREVVVDEYQDLSPAQIALVNALCGHGRPRSPDDRHRLPVAHLTVVGDPRQAIYEWNGADPKPLLDLRHSSSARVIDLQKSFRSTSAILELANRTIAPVMPELPGLVAVTPGEGTITIVGKPSDYEMFEHVATIVRAWIDQGIADDEIAVLAHKGKTVGDIRKALKRHGIVSHDEGLGRISATEVFRRMRQAVHEHSEPESEDMSLIDHLDLLAARLEAADAAQRDEKSLDDWERLRAEVEERLNGDAKSLEDALDRIRKSDEGPQSSAGVTLTTMHKAKGMEWTAVAVTDVSGTGLDSGKDQERCRLLYVAITRAKRHLDISWCIQPSQWLPR